MNEYVLVEFCAVNPSDETQLCQELHKLGDAFVSINSNHHDHYLRVYGKMESSLVTFIAIQSPFLAERMHISYIDDKLKDKYRK